MTFDLFGDFESRGYLRNVEQEKDLDIVRRLEHVSFTTGLDAAFKQLSGATDLQGRSGYAQDAIRGGVSVGWRGPGP